MWLAFLALSVAAEPSAEDLFKKMEQAVLKSKTLQTDVEVTAGSDTDSLMNMKGRLLVAPGGKMRMELEGTIRKDAETMTMVSDGKKAKMESAKRPGAESDAPKFISDISLAAISRGGVVASIFRARAEPVNGKDGEADNAFDVQKMFPVTDLKLGKKERIGDIEAQAIEYKAGMKGAEETMSVTMWLDAKTSLPLKRIAVFKEGNQTINLTEIYSNMKLDGKIDDKEFEVKAKK